MAIKKNMNYEIHLGGYDGGRLRKVNKVTLNETSIILYVGDEHDLFYSIFPSNGIYEEVEWISSDESIATIDENGHIIALSDGTVIITVKIYNAIARCRVEVRDVINFKDPLVKKILVRNYDRDGDGEISYKEAAFVRSIPFSMFTAMPITSFDELEYFTGVTTIGQHAFDSCTYLTSIKFPYTLESIKKNAFSYCTSLSEITITPSVSNIGSEAFSDCDNLTTAYVNSNVPSRNGNKIFDRCKNLDRIIVPGDYIDDYLNAINWGMLNNEEYLYYSYMIYQCFDYTFDFFLS